ncbi:MAG: hypothetical protein OEZ01_08000 [Candidatus Heimdallarchaeota archaeon]|nr:hypothetical protein [Candidatus Heimdallarchaeota archaeon]MDH5645935.1 hypothetical protein [Candidatus Heimdallarchaeota archaeon]
MSFAAAIKNGLLYLVLAIGFIIAGGIHLAKTLVILNGLTGIEDENYGLVQSRMVIGLILILVLPNIFYLKAISDTVQDGMAWE